MAKRLFNFFIYSNLFIAGCAVAMIVQTYSLVLKMQPDVHFIWFAFFSTICSYSFHWYLTEGSLIPSPRITWLERNRKVHVILFVAGLIGSVIFFFYLLPGWYWLLLSAFITFLYSAPKIPHPSFRALRKVAWGKTIFLALVWMHVTTLLPILISGQEWKPDFVFFIGSRFFLIYAICILFDWRDRDDDRANGIRSLITLLNERGIFILFNLSVLLFAVSTILLSLYGYSVTVIVILLLPGFITAFLYKTAKENLSDSFYYIILDGLMALSSLIMLIPGI